MKKIVVVLLFCFCNSVVFSQAIVSGKLSSLDGTIPVGVNIAIYPKHDLGNIIAYGFSDSKGSFRISVKHSQDSIALALKSMAYTDTLLFLANLSQDLSIILESKVYSIPEVSVRANIPIHQKGDTTVYSVESFAQQKDFSVGDVIKKMPGFEVSESGTISYQGQKIQKYYIEGLDLLGGGYPLANNNLPHTAVRAVEVLHNHQPIKAIDGVVDSDRTSLNIRLKSSVTATGQLQAGIGLSPLLWDVNLTPMLFAKNQQAIGSLQLNNVGRDLGSQHQSITVKDGRIEYGTMNQSYVGIPNMSQPTAIAKNKYLDNKSHLFTYNHLIKVGKATQLKINASYLHEKIEQERVSTTTYYLEDSVMTIQENQQNDLLRHNLIVNLNLEQNVKSRYLTNKLSFGGFWDKDNALIYNLSDINIKAKTPHATISNSFDALIPVRKNFLRVESLLHFNDSPQELFFHPAVFSTGNNTMQQVHNRNFGTTNSLSFSLPIGKRFLFSSSLGFNYEAQEHKTRILTNGIWNTTDSLNNHLKWNRSQFELKEEFQYKKGDLVITLRTPLEYILLNIDDKIHLADKELGRWFFKPSFSIRHKFFGRINSYLGGGYSEALGSANNMLQGAVIVSHRQMYSRLSEIDISKSKYLAAGLNYRNPIAGLFIDISGSMSFGMKNLITNQRLEGNGLLILETIEQENKTNFNNLSSEISWYISTLKTTLGLKADYSDSKIEYIFNGQLGTSTLIQYSLNPKAMFNFSRYFSADYQYRITTMHTNTSTNIWEQKHKCDFYVYPKSNHLIGVEVELYDIRQTGKSDNQSLFANIVYSYKLSKSRIDLRLECRNLFNATKITDIQQSDITLFQTEYYLRPRQFLLTARMSLGKRKQPTVSVK